MNTWNATDAKRNFSQLLRTAEVEPQLVVRRGIPLGVIMGYQQSTNTVAGWLDQLEEIRDVEADFAMPDRRDRPDQFGEAWE